MLVNKHCQVTLGSQPTPFESETGRRFTANYPEIAERGLTFPTNDNKAPLSTHLKKIGLWGIIIASIFCAFYFT